MVLTKTSISAIRALVYLGLHDTGEPVSPRHVAGRLGESQTYLAKVMRHLVKAGILRAHRGGGGGVTLNRPPEQITLLAVVEACQGAIQGNFCEDAEDLAKTCAFHQAAGELHRAVVDVLSRWTLAQLLIKPRPSPELVDRHIQCWLAPLPEEDPAETPAASAEGRDRAGE